MADLPEIADVKRWTIRPGDTLVLRLHRHPDMSEVDQIRDVVRAAVGDVPVLVLGPGDDIEVVGQPGGDT